MKKSRRALVFTVPKGKEEHYLRIPRRYALPPRFAIPGLEAHFKFSTQMYVGRRWAPFFHAYGYYLPTINVPLRIQDHINKKLKEQSLDSLRATGIQLMLLWLALGGNRALIGLIGGILFAEMESYFAYWDGHVTFGSSHVTAHSIGYGLVSMMLQKKLTIWMLPFLIYTTPLFYTFVTWWARDGFKVVGSGIYRPGGHSLHRVDHLAHIGGMVAGAITALLTKNKRLF